MSHSREALVLDQAVSWHIRLKEADDQAWVEFAEWLAANPAHNDAYEAVADEDERLSPYLSVAAFPAGLENSASHRANTDYLEEVDGVGRNTASRPALLRWGALAASIAAAAVLAFQFMPAGSEKYTLATAPGEVRTIALADGSEIMLNGASKIILDRNHERQAELLSGEARFKVTHDDAAPFTVIAGDSRIVDVGTVFNVVRTNQQLRVAVAEGAVRFEGSSGKLDLKPGDAISVDSGGSIRIARRPTSAIGSWTQGALVYEAAPLGTIAEDLSRSLGVTMSLSAAMRSKPFTGVIQTDGNRAAIRARLEQLIGVPIVADGSNWTVQE